MSDYMGNTPIPGATPDQNLATGMLLRTFDPAAHDGLQRNLAAVLDASGFSDQQLQAALLKVLTDASGVYIPPALFPRPGLTCKPPLQVMAARTALASQATLSANATTI